MDKNSIEYQLSFIKEHPSGRLYLETFRYKKISNIMGFDFDNMNNNQKMIFKSFVLDERVFKDMDLDRYGIFKK